MNAEIQSADGPPRRFWGYASANGSIAVLRQLAVFFPLFFYTTGGFLSAQQVGLALTIARLIDVVSDPIVGYASDRTRHRWGKRLPYIVFGAPLWLLFTVLLFAPPMAGEHPANFAWLAALGSLYFVAMTVVQIPYMAVLPEITHSPEETLRVSVRMGKCFLAGVLLVLAGGFALAQALGFLGATFLFAALCVIPFALAARELFGVPQHPVDQHAEDFLSSAWTIVRQRPFWTYLAGHSLFVLGYYMMLVACPFLVTSIVGLPKGATGAFLLLAMLTAIVAAPLVERAALRFGKRALMLAAMGLFVVIFVFWFCLGRVPGLEGTARAAEVLGIAALGEVRFSVLAEVCVFFVLAGLAASVQMLLPNAIVSDLVLFDAEQTGRRREALVFGLQGGIEKNAVMLATLLAGVALQRGSTPEDPAGIYAIGPIAAAASLLGLLIFLLYPLGRDWEAQRRLKAPSSRP